MRCSARSDPAAVGTPPPSAPFIMPPLRATLLSLVAASGGLVSTCRAFSLVSSAWDDGEAIPSEYLADGDNISPPLEFLQAPSGTKAFALIVDDHDAPKGEGVHWLVYNIPHEKPKLEEEVSSGDGISRVAEVLTTKPPPKEKKGGMAGLGAGPGMDMMSMGGGDMPDMPDSFYTIGMEGMTSKAVGTGKPVWSGPQPGPSPKTLKFKGYALNDKLELAAGASRSEVLAAMKGKVIDKTTLTATVDAGKKQAKPKKKKKATGTW
eukprot:COSAG01_NODE_3880_length_5592_cov_25.973603_4_plen_264_part_00